ncbi:MAG: PAS domain-containing protein, partial [Burkholderiaceae bacterium]
MSDMPSETVTAADVAPTARDRLVRSAAYAAGCAFAILYADVRGEPVPLSCIGLSAPPLTPDDACLARMMRLEPASLFLVNDIALDVPEGDAPCLFGDDVPARFVAAVPVFDPAGMRRGVLVLGDMAPHAGLTPAQTYVLHTHAAQLGLQMALAEGATAAPDPAAERLRLLESVVVNAKDAILITEAEPIDEPGPRIVYYNAAFTRITGYDETDVVGRTPRLLQSGRTSRAAHEPQRSAQKTRKPHE